MSLSRAMRLSGLAALVGYALYAVVNFTIVFTFPENMALSVATTSTHWFVLKVLEDVALLLFLLGLFGLYVRQAEQVGVFGLIGAVMAFFGGALLLAVEWSETFIYPVVGQAAPQLMDHPNPNLLTALNTAQTIHWLLLSLGWILFAVATLRGGVLPRGAAVALLIAGVLAFASGVVGVDSPFVDAPGILLSLLGIGWMGYAVWSRPAAVVSNPTLAASGPSLANR
jgi:hypothetical protein